MSAGPDRRAAARGFTLIELIVTIALVAILARIAVPSFITLINGSRLTATANSFIGSMASARAEAMKANKDTYVMPATSANLSSSNCTAATSVAWSTCGWFVFVDLNKSGLYEPANDMLIAQQEPPSALVTTPGNSGVSQFIDGASQYVLYNGSGFPKLKSGGFAVQSLDFAYGTATDGSTTRRVISSQTGRMWICTPTAANVSSGACDPTAN